MTPPFRTLPRWRGLVCCLVWLGLVSGPGRAQPAGVAPLAGVQPQSIRLSESTTLTLALEGPAPLRVALPEEPGKLLTPASAAVWRIRPAGPSTVAPLPGGRERWEQAYRLDPFTPGDAVPVAFASVKVTAGADLNPQVVTWPAQEVRVQTTLARPTPDDARPVTGIEPLPPPPPPNPAAVGWQVAAGLAAVFAAVLTGVVVRRWRVKPPPLPPGEWAARELDRLERELSAGRVSGSEVADRTSTILRGYVERRHGLPAPKLTTAELIAEDERAGWPAELSAVLRVMLERCDRAKFAGDPPAETEATELVARAREWVTAEAGTTGATLTSA